MAVNRYKPHLVIFLEDEPYRELVNGAKLLPNVNDAVLDTKSPCKGWPKVFAELEDNLDLLNRKESMYALLLMDFDNDFQGRITKFNTILASQDCHGRVFLLGIDKKESEDLKKELAKSNNEEIGKLLLQNCPNGDEELWQNTHLACNQSEIQRMRASGVFSWLFI